MMRHLQAIVAEADAYAVELSRSMPLNPVRAGIVTRLEHYPWSTSRSDIGHSTTPEWLKTALIRGSFGRKAPDAKKTYRRFVEDLRMGAYESPLKVMGTPTV